MPRAPVERPIRSSGSIRRTVSAQFASSGTIVFSLKNNRPSMNLRVLSAVAAATLFATLLPSASAFADDAPAERWVSAWGTALQAIPQRADLPALYRAPEIGGRTVRQIVYPAIDGRHVRLRFSNVYGTAPLVIEGVQVARSVSGGTAAIRVGTSRPVTFAGKAGVTIAPGGQMDSDPIAFDVAAHQPLAVSTYIAAGQKMAAWHRVANQTNYVSTPGNHSSDTDAIAFRTRFTQFVWLTSVSVDTTPARAGRNRRLDHLWYALHAEREPALARCFGASADAKGYRRHCRRERGNQR